MNLSSRIRAAFCGTPTLPSGAIDLVLGSVFLTGSIWYAQGARTFPKPLNQAHVGAGVFPTLIALALITSSLAIMLLSLRRMARRDPSTIQLGRPLCVGLAVLSLVLFAEMFEVIGAIAAIALMCLVIQLLVGERRIFVLIGLPLGLALSVYAAFSLLLGVVLP